MNPSLLRKLFGDFKPRYLPVLLTYFCYGASALTGVAMVFFQKDTLGLTPADVAEVGFWLGLPWGMKMVAGVAADEYPLFGSRRTAYLLLGVFCSVTGYAALATVVSTKNAFLLASLLVTVGFMVQDVVADALSVEVAENDEELGQIQALGRMALLAGGISVSYLGGVLASAIGARAVFAIAAALPLIVGASVLLLPQESGAGAKSASEHGALLYSPPLILAAGLGYALAGALLQIFAVPLAQEITLLISALLIGVMLKTVGVSRAVVISALVIFLFRATPSVGQGYNYWAIDKLGFDQEFLGLLAQVSAVLSLAGLLVFRKLIIERPASFTLFWLVIVGSVLYLPSVGLFYGLNEWFGMSPRTFAFIDTTISAPLGQLSMVPILVLIAKSAPKGSEATMFAIMASLMNLALSASELFTRYLNDWFAVTQTSYGNLGQLMIVVLMIGVLPLFALPTLRRVESQPET